MVTLKHIFYYANYMMVKNLNRNTRGISEKYCYALSFFIILFVTTQNLILEKKKLLVKLNLDFVFHNKDSKLMTQQDRRGGGSLNKYQI